MAKLENLDRTVAIELPDNAHWPDEFGGWVPKAQSSQRSAAGGLITQARVLIAGQPIELVDFWLKRAAVVALHTWASGLEKYFLTLPDGREFPVQFGNDAPLKATPVFEDAAPDDDTEYHVSSLAFVTI